MKINLATLALFFVTIAVGFGWYADSKKRSKPVFLHVYQQRDADMSLAVVECSTQLAVNHPFYFEVPDNYRVAGQLNSGFSGGYHLVLDAQVTGTGFRVNKSIELDKPIYATEFLVSGEVFWSVGVITTEPNAKTFLKENHASLSIANQK